MRLNIDLSPQILESIFYKNSPLRWCGHFKKQHHHRHTGGTSCHAKTVNSPAILVFAIALDLALQKKQTPWLW